mgnify:CR=1 FL=1
MLLNNKLFYEKRYLVEIGKPTDNLYYFFDYDERYYDINMEFQHFHHFYEIHVLLDDNANHIIEGNLYRIEFLDFVCLKPYCLHKSEYPKGPSKKRLVIQFSIPEQSGLFHNNVSELLSIFDAPLPIYRFDQTNQDSIIHILNEIFLISKSESAVQALSIHCKFIELLCAIYNRRNENIYQSDTLDTTASKIYSIASYIHNHYNEELSLSILAQRFFLSKYYLSHLFKEVTGFSLTDYIQMTRIRNAQQLLLFTDKKITDIAAQCGFTSFSQFNRVFNKFCKTSPSDYRKKESMIYSKKNPLPVVYIRD